jgi:hypothetical protein
MELINCDYSALLIFVRARAYNHNAISENSMQLQRSRGSSLFPYYYKNGELFCIHFGIYFSDEDEVIAMMKAEENFFNRQYRNIGIWIDFYETKLTNRVLRELVELLKQIHLKTTKLGIVGCPLFAQWKMNRMIKKTEILAFLPVKYFADPEEAKTWLVSESE